MPQSLTKIYIHIIFSTKKRIPVLDPAISSELYPYLATAFKSCDSIPIKIGGHRDHVHVFGLLTKNNALTKVIEVIKKDSSKWIKTKGAQFKKFSWQVGYAAFSVGENHKDTLIKYIEDQEKHHKQLLYKDEVIKFLKKYKVDYNEKYLWG